MSKELDELIGKWEAKHTGSDYFWRNMYSELLTHYRAQELSARPEARLRGQTIEQWAERATISERNLEEWVRAHSTSMPFGIGDHPEHVHTDKCSFDRNSSISEDRYVCECGWRDEPQHDGEKK